MATKTLALASLSYQQGESERALADATAALRELSELRNISGVVMALDWIAALSATTNPAKAVRMAGAASALRTTLGGGMRPESVGLESARTAAERTLDEDLINQLWHDGEQLSLEEAVAEALEAPYSLTALTEI